MDKKTISVEQMAVMLGVGRATAYSLANDPSFFPAFRIGRKILISIEKLDEWLAKQGEKVV